MVWLSKGSSSYVFPQTWLRCYCGKKAVKLLVNNKHMWKQAEGRAGKSGLAMLHLWCAAPSQRASGKFSRQNLMVGLERYLAEGMRNMFKWLFTCLYNFFFRTQNSDQWFLLIANKSNELRPFCFLASPFMLWCLFNDQRHSEKWQPSLLEVLGPHVLPWVWKKKKVAAAQNTEPTSWALAGESGLCGVGCLQVPHSLGLGRACRSKGDLAWKRLWIIQHQKHAKVVLSVPLSLPPCSWTKKLLTYFEAHIFEICLQHSLTPKWRPELRPPGSFHQEMVQGWCWAPVGAGCAFSLT